MTKKCRKCWITQVYSYYTHIPTIPNIHDEINRWRYATDNIVIIKERRRVTHRCWLIWYLDPWFYLYQRRQPTHTLSFTQTHTYTFTHTHTHTHTIEYSLKHPYKRYITILRSIAKHNWKQMSTQDWDIQCCSK